jgi:hypothetical protein
VLVVKEKDGGEVEEEIQILIHYRHRALSHCGETSKHFNARWQYRVHSLCQRGPLVVNSHQHRRQLLGQLLVLEIHQA